MQLNSSVRAKTCNLIGNLCRHSTSWYCDLQQPVFLSAAGSRKIDKKIIDKSRDAAVDIIPAFESLLSILISCCADADDATRKFACFAIGNSAFHSNLLYPQLSDAIPLLLSALDDNDEKTRANAAGALGNLVRNGPELATDLCVFAAVDRLVVMCLREKMIFPQVLLQYSLATFK